ncbi:MAG TPA: 4-phosphopantetheinyl transferase [Flavobacterium sp.]|nr:4-phosphopantetheinyl transferase [Flavobacterium sp.]
MPFYKVVFLSHNTKLYLWKITESKDQLLQGIALRDASLGRLEKMKSESHKKGFLAIRKLLEHIDYSDFDLYYDANGKPHLKPQGCFVKNKYISISHSYDFSAVAISDVEIGIDVEILKEKTLKLAPRFMNVLHLDHLNLNEKIQKATIIWGIKESIFKIKNEKGISFPTHIFEARFLLLDKKTTAELRFNDKTEKFDIEFDVFDDYIFVCAFQK